MSERPRRIVTAAALIAAAACVTSLAYAAEHDVCVITIGDQKHPEDVVSEVSKKCRADDVLSLSVIAQTKENGEYLSHAVGMLCRFDRQILFIPDSRSALCVYRGRPRSVVLGK